MMRDREGATAAGSRRPPAPASGRQGARPGRVLGSAAAIAAGALALVVATAHAEGPSVETIARNCMGCHGEDGVSPGNMPTIYGKSKEWTIQRLEEFRSGDRESTIMGRIMKAFAEEDIEALAEYFSARR